MNDFFDVMGTVFTSVANGAASKVGSLFDAGAGLYDSIDMSAFTDAVESLGGKPNTDLLGSAGGLMSIAAGEKKVGTLDDQLNVMRGSNDPTATNTETKNNGVFGTDISKGDLFRGAAGAAGAYMASREKSKDRQSALQQRQMMIDANSALAAQNQSYKRVDDVGASGGIMGIQRQRALQAAKNNARVNAGAVI